MGKIENCQSNRGAIVSGFRDTLLFYTRMSRDLTQLTKLFLLSTLETSSTESLTLNNDVIFKLLELGLCK